MTVQPVQCCPTTLAAGSQPGRVSVVEGHDSENVHLVQVDSRAPVGVSFCGQAVTRHVPRRLFHESGCATCRAIALAGGCLYAEDKHGALVNLRRSR